MSLYCLKCRENTEGKKIVKTKNEWMMLLSECAVCDSKKSKFIKDQEASGLSSRLERRTPLRKILLAGSLLF